MLMCNTNKKVVFSLWIIHIILRYCQAQNNDVGSPQKQTADVSDLTGTRQLVSNDRHQQLFIAHRDGDKDVKKDQGNQQSSPDPKMTAEQEPLQLSLDEAMGQSIQQRSEAQALTVATNDKERTMLASRHQQNNADTREGLSHTAYMTHTSLKHDVGAPSIQGDSQGLSQVKTNVDRSKKNTTIEIGAVQLKKDVVGFYQNYARELELSAHGYGLNVSARIPIYLETKHFTRMSMSIPMKYRYRNAENVVLNKMTIKGHRKHPKSWQSKQPRGVSGFKGIRWAHPRKQRETRFLQRTRRQTGGVQYTEDGNPRVPLDVDQSCRCEDLCQTVEVTYWRDPFENVAFHKPVTASSSISWLNPECAATKGMDCPNQLSSADDWCSKSPAVSCKAEEIGCFQSDDYDKLPWVQIDLMHVFTFQNITYFRRNCEDDSGADKYRVLALDVVLDGRLLYSFPGYANKSWADTAGIHLTIPTRVVTGRYLRFEKRPVEVNSEWNYHITICAVDIWVCKPGTYGSYGKTCEPCPADCDHPCNNYFGCSEVFHNVAIMKSTDQVIAGTGSSDYPVDGARPFGQDTDCTVMESTDMDLLVWWRVNLGRMYKVYYVNITARRQCCGPEFLQNFGVSVTEEMIIDGQDPKTRCMFHTKGVLTRTSLTKNCTRPLIGYTIWVWSYGAIGFCDFQAFGHAFYRLKAGSACSPTSKFAVCNKKTVCQDGTCKAKHSSQCKRDEECADSLVCNIGKCRSNFGGECKDAGDCRIGAICHKESSTCSLRYGADCSGEKRGFCTPDAVCDKYKRCQIRPGKKCSEDSQCSAGATCKEEKCACKPLISTLESGSCEPVTGRIGSTCGPESECIEGSCIEAVCTCGEEYVPFYRDFSCRKKVGASCSDDASCSISLVCDSGTCKIDLGESCYANEDKCKSGTACTFELCTLLHGQSCKGKEHLCPVLSSCIDGICKIPLGGNCANNENHCNKGVCSSEDDSTCRIPAGSLLADQTADLCVSGAIFLNQKCTMPYGQKCKNRNECIPAAVCARREGDQTLKCRRMLGSPGCQLDDECSSGAVCDVQGYCRVAKGAACSKKAGMCVFGSQCVGGKCQCNEQLTISSSEKCEPQKDQIGGRCERSSAGGNREVECGQKVASCNKISRCECGTGYEADPTTLKCHAVAGSSCADKSLPGCLTGTECDQFQMCVIKAGMSCAGAKRGFCKIGTVCDLKSEICKIDVDQSCAGNTEICREGAVCDSLNRCKMPPTSPCRDDQNCMAGSKCADGKCACIDGVSTLTDESCVPVNGMMGGVCEGSSCSDSLAVCNETTGKCQCKPGYSGNSETLACAKSPGEDCTESSECVTNLCDPVDNICGVEVGKICDGEFCASGLICDSDFVCRVDRLGSCEGENYHFCRLGTFCDVFSYCNYGVGEKCNATEKNPCVVGADCVDGECECNLTISSSAGTTCEPLPGRIGGTCDVECKVPDSVCKEGICECNEPMVPDRNFSCGGVPTSKLVSDGAKYMGIIIGCAVLLVVMVGVLVFLVARRKKQQKTRAVVTQRRASAYVIQDLKQDAEDIAILENKLGVNKGGEEGEPSTGGSELSDASGQSGLSSASGVSSASGHSSPSELSQQPSASDLSSVGGPTSVADSSAAEQASTAGSELSSAAEPSTTLA